MKWLKKMFCKHKDMAKHSSSRDSMCSPVCCWCSDCSQYFMEGIGGRIKVSKGDFYEIQLDCHETSRRLFDIGNSGREVPHEFLEEVIPFYDAFLKEKDCREGKSVV